MANMTLIGILSLSLLFSCSEKKFEEELVSKNFTEFQESEIYQMLPKNFSETPVMYVEYNDDNHYNDTAIQACVFKNSDTSFTFILLLFNGSDNKERKLKHYGKDNNIYEINNNYVYKSRVIFGNIGVLKFNSILSKLKSINSQQSANYNYKPKCIAVINSNGQKLKYSSNALIPSQVISLF